MAAVLELDKEEILTDGKKKAFKAKIRRLRSLLDSDKKEQSGTFAYLIKPWTKTGLPADDFLNERNYFAGCRPARHDFGLLFLKSPITKSGANCFGQAKLAAWLGLICSKTLLNICH